MFKTRFAPSPTGFLHVGGLRTALYAYLVARKNQGKFLLRIEDTDQERTVVGGVENILKSLAWAGIVVDEGVVEKDGKIIQVGDNGPYIQSERLEIYKKYVDELVVKDFAYPCFCSAERLTELRDYQQKNKLPTGYDGCCQKLSKEEIAKKISTGEKYVIRMKMSEIGETKFVDEIRGEVVFKNELIDDQIILKSDGFPTYHLAVVVDDHLMEINYVIRGEEWLSSTPKHLQLYKYLGWEPPKFAHLPLILNPDKSKLSKRQGDVAVEDYRAKGYLPEALINFVAFLGWNPGDERELFTLDELIEDFTVEKVGRAGAVFNLEKLNWYNKEYLKKKDNKELVILTKQFFMIAGVDLENKDDTWLVKAIALEKERATTLLELAENLRFVFTLPDYEGKILVWKKSDTTSAKKILNELKEFLEQIPESDWMKDKMAEKIGEWIKEKNLTNGEVLWPLRVALSGQENSPGPFEIAEVLGKEESLRRVEKGIKKLN